MFCRNKQTNKTPNEYRLFSFQSFPRVDIKPYLATSYPSLTIPLLLSPAHLPSLNNFIKAIHLNSGLLNPRARLAFALLQGTAVSVNGAPWCTVAMWQHWQPCPRKSAGCQIFKITDRGGRGKVIHFHWGWHTHPEVAGKAQGFRSFSFFLSQEGICEA